MIITINGSSVEFPNPVDFDANDNDNTHGNNLYERARRTAEDTVQALLIKAFEGKGPRVPAPESPDSVKRYAPLGRTVETEYRKWLESSDDSLATLGARVRNAIIGDGFVR
jgi:hypothetical protein